MSQCGEGEPRHNPNKALEADIVLVVDAAQTVPPFASTRRHLA